MNNDGWGQVGAGQDDRRLAGSDLQHNVQKRTADEGHVPPRMVRQEAEGGGPMKEHMEHKAHKMHEHLAEEKHRHHEAMKHHEHHLAKHHGRQYDSQHGHDHYSY